MGNSNKIREIILWIITIIAGLLSLFPILYLFLLLVLLTLLCR